jgi:hypothetical protein
VRFEVLEVKTVKITVEKYDAVQFSKQALTFRGKFLSLSEYNYALLSCRLRMITLLHAMQFLSRQEESAK